MGGLNNDQPPPTRPRRYLENGSARAPAVDGFRSLSSLEQILRFAFQVLSKYSPRSSNTDFFPRRRFIFVADRKPSKPKAPRFLSSP